MSRKEHLSTVSVKNCFPLPNVIFRQIDKSCFKGMNSPGPEKSGAISCLEQKEGKFGDTESSKTRLSRQDWLECLDFGI